MSGVSFRITTRGEGDFAITAPDATDGSLDERRAAVVDLPWVWLTQQHGAEVVVVDLDSAGDARGRPGDALVTTSPGVALSVQTADCAPLVLLGDPGLPDAPFGVVHAGWRGLVAGVVAAAATALRGVGATTVQAILGPCIHPGSYAFASDDLEPLVARFGPAVHGRTHEGDGALDLPAAVDAACVEADVDLVASVGSCTAQHHELWYSHRARRESARMATVAWRAPPAGASSRGR